MTKQTEPSAELYTPGVTVVGGQTDSARYDHGRIPTRNHRDADFHAAEGAFGERVAADNRQLHLDLMERMIREREAKQ